MSSSSNSTVLEEQVLKFNSTHSALIPSSNVAMNSAFKSSLLILKPREFTPLFKTSSALALAALASLTTIS